MGAIKVPDEILDFIKKALEELKGTLKKGDIQDFIIDSALIRLDVIIPEEKEDLRKELYSLIEKYEVSPTEDELGKYLSYPFRKIEKYYKKIEKVLSEISKLVEVFGKVEKD